MSTTTPRLALPYPVSSDPNNVPSDMGNLAGRLDSILGAESSGTLAARPSSSTAGFKYFATDVANSSGTNGTWFYYTGTAWVPLNGSLDAAAVANAADKSSGSTQVFTGSVEAPTLEVSGRTGAATAAYSFAGMTASGAPTTGTFSTYDIVMDETGGIWMCTAAGTPGTWVRLNSGHFTARVYQSSAWNTTTGPIVFKFNAVAYDYASMYSTSTGLFTIRIPGIYRVTAQIGASGTLGQNMQAFAYHTGGAGEEDGGPLVMSSNSGGNIELNAGVDTEFACGVNDTIGIWYEASALNMAGEFNSTPGTRTRAIVRYVCPAM